MTTQEINKLVIDVLGEGSKVLHPLLGGMMNLSYLLEDKNGKKYILYISTEQANEMVDRVLEKEHQRIVYELGITSKNIYFDTVKGIKINEFIEGDSLDKISSFDYEKIATLFHKLHSSIMLSRVDYSPFNRFVNEYEKEALSFNKEVSPLYNELRELRKKTDKKIVEINEIEELIETIERNK